MPGIGDICDGINAVISFLRKAYLAAAISVACLALPVVADAIFKPIKKLVTNASDFATKAIWGLSKAGHKPSKLISGITSFCNGVKGFVKDCWLIPGKIKTKVAGWIDTAKDYVKDLFESAKTKLGKEASQEVAQKGASGAGKLFDVKNPKSFEGSNIKDVESYLDDVLNGFEKQPLKNGEGVRYFDGKGNSWQLNYGYENATDAIHGGAYLKTTVGSDKIRIPLSK